MGIKTFAEMHVKYKGKSIVVSILCNLNQGLWKIPSIETICLANISLFSIIKIYLICTMKDLSLTKLYVYLHLTL